MTSAPFGTVKLELFCGHRGFCSNFLKLSNDTWPKVSCNSIACGAPSFKPMRDAIEGRVLRLRRRLQPFQPSLVPASFSVKFFSRSLLPNRIAAGEEPSASPSRFTVTWFKSLS